MPEFLTPKISKRPGQTLVEVTIAILIAATTTVAVFSVILSSFVSEKKSDKKELSAMVLKKARQTLQAFVSVDPSDPNYSPNAGGIWTGVDASGQWALAAGTHDISSLMNTAENAVLRRDTSSGAVPDCVMGGSCYLYYTVEDSDYINGHFLIPPQPTNTPSKSSKTVKFHMRYAD